MASAPPGLLLRLDLLSRRLAGHSVAKQRNSALGWVDPDLHWSSNYRSGMVAFYEGLLRNDGLSESRLPVGLTLARHDQCPALDQHDHEPLARALHRNPTAREKRVRPAVVHDGHGQLRSTLRGSVCPRSGGAFRKGPDDSLAVPVSRYSRCNTDDDEHGLRIQSRRFVI